MDKTPFNLHVSSHPLVRHKLTHMQNRHISSQQFYRLMKELGMLLAYEATAHLAVEPAPPFEPSDDPPDDRSQVLAGPKPVIVPVLRSGLAMAEGIREVMPFVRTGHLGILQGPQHEPTEYLIALPETKSRTFIVVDAIIATGKSALRAGELLTRSQAETPGEAFSEGVAEDRLVFCVALATEEGAGVLLERFPKARVVAGGLASFIGETKDVAPWIGHVGNRLFFGERP